MFLLEGGGSYLGAGVQRDWREGQFLLGTTLALSSLHPNTHPPHLGLGTHSQTGIISDFIRNIKMFKCQQSGVQTFQGKVPIRFCLGFFFFFFLNNCLFDKLALDPVLGIGEGRTSEGVVIGGLGGGL
jgi:hypothetical protein